MITTSKNDRRSIDFVTCSGHNIAQRFHFLVTVILAGDDSFTVGKGKFIVL
jgi:hypothetical protein